MNFQKKTVQKLEPSPLHLQGGVNPRWENMKRRPIMAANKKSNIKKAKRTGEPGGPEEPGEEVIRGNSAGPGGGNR